MKKVIMIMLLVAVSCQMTGCSLFTSYELNNDSVFDKWGGNVPEREKTDAEICTVDEVSFAVPAGWTPLSSYEGAYLSPDGGAAFHLQGVSHLGNNTPEAFYDVLLEHYRTSYEVLSSDASMTSLQLEDGSAGFVSNMVTYDGNVYYNIDLLIVPQKNKVLTLTAQYKEKETAVNVRQFTESVRIDIGCCDMISGNVFHCEDGSQLQFASDGSYIYYQTAEDPTSPYISGEYEVFYGQAAIDQVSRMTEYGLTADELETTLSANMNGYRPGGSSPMDFFSESTDEGYHVCLDTFYAVILHNEQLIEGNDITEIGKDSLYVGYFLYELDMADMVNANTANYAQWTLEN